MTPEIAEKLVTLNELHRNRWRPDIVNLLLEDGTLRFGELQKKLGITQKVLTSNLKWLEENKIVTRKVYPEVPPRVEYSLTDVGQQLQDVHEAMRVRADYYVTHVK
ncbi:MarR family transcriptional regulator [Weissella confusa]|nr:MarR family transcriptional regulator [Weissella confusa]